MRKLCILLFSIVLPIAAIAEGTRTWQQSKFDEFEKGTAKGVAIGSEGWLELAPAFTPLATTPSTYIWTITADSAGNAYLAAGAPARVYRVTPDGQVSIVFEPKELQVQTVVVAPEGTLFAATSPDGKVYKIVRNASAAPAPAGKGAKTAADENSKTDSKVKSSEKAVNTEATLDPAYTASVYFDPKTKYIWDLALDPKGQLYIATGDHGEIFRVDRSGEGTTFFKSDEAHIRVLAFDKSGNIIAGSDGSGLIYRISPTGEAFVLYSAPKKEITALALDDAGNIYAAGAGEKRQATTPVPPSTAQVTSTAPPPPAGQNVTITTTAPPSQPGPPLPVPPSGGSEIYRIASDGSPMRWWTSREDLIYALHFEGSAAKGGELLAATGNKGRIFAIRGNGEFTDLLKASATQVTGFAPSPRGMFVSTSNLGKVFMLGSGPEAEGVYESDVFDGRNFARWGRAEVRGRGNFAILARSGNVDNPDRNWSPWAPVDRASDEALQVPPARFVQWKAVLKPGDPKAHIDSATLNYRPKNIAPQVDDVTVQVGVRYPAPVRSATTDRGDAANAAGGTAAPKTYDSMPSPSRDRNSIGVRWSAQDDNDDDLSFTLFYRGDGEREWRPLTKDKVSERYFSFDSDLLPDGGYTIKVVASDAPSNTPEDTLIAEKESARFEVDTTPPRVEDLTAASDGDQVHVTFRASDSFSPVRRAEYSLDAGDWQFVEPVGQLSDSRNENYDFNIAVGGGSLVPAAAKSTDDRKKSKDKKKKNNPKPSNPPTVPEKNGDPPSEEHVLVVRVYDRFDNVSSAKTVVRK